MFELLGLLGGGVVRLVPFIFDFFKQRADQAHELAMMDKQRAIDEARSKQAMDMAHVQGAIAAEQGEMAAMAKAIEDQGKPTGVAWVDALSASVRPILTYYWTIGLYGSAKAIQVVVAFQQNAALAAFVPILITDFDKSVIGSMLGFWFVDRALKKLGK